MTLTSVRDPIELPATGPANREVIIHDDIRGGQPRPYADTEDVDHITIRHYDWNGDLVTNDELVARIRANEISDELAADIEHRLVANALRASRYNRPYRVSSGLGEALADNPYVRDADYEVRDATTMDGHFSSYLDYAEPVGNFTVEIRYVTPFTD